MPSVDWRARARELEGEEWVSTVGLAVLGPTLALTLTETAASFVRLVPALREVPWGRYAQFDSTWVLFPASLVLVAGPAWGAGMAAKLAFAPGLLAMALVAYSLPTAWEWPGLPSLPHGWLGNTLGRGCSGSSR